MVSIAVPFPSQSAPNSKAETGGRLVNVYIEKLDDGRTVYRRSPGLEQVSTSATHLGCRGMIAINDDLLVARGSRLTKITKSGVTYTATDLGALGGSGPVYFARNNKSPTPDIVAVTDSTAYLITTSSAPASYPDADVQSPNSVTAIGGYLIFSYGDGRMRATGLNSTAIATTDEATAETRPDGLSRVAQIGNDIIAFGPRSLEFWTNTGESPGYPLSYRTTIDVGLAAPDAVAGRDDGFIGQVIFVGSDNIVYALNGYQRQRVSSHTLERLIAGLSTASRAAMRAQVYMHAGHACWALTTPEWCWVYDITMGKWTERQSYGQASWRAAYSAFVFGEWIMGDGATGQVYRVSESYRREGPSTPLVAVVRSGVMTGFPNRSAWQRLDIDIMAGVGLAGGESPIQTAPVCSVGISRDGGVTMTPRGDYPIGAQGEFSRNIRVLRNGLVSQRGAQVELRVSDPVEFTLFGATATFDKRAS